MPHTRIGKTEVRLYEDEDGQKPDALLKTIPPDTLLKTIPVAAMVALVLVAISVILKGTIWH